MSNVLTEEKKNQVIALGRLGWSLRRIERETGVRRETVAGYLKAAGIGVRFPGAWGRHLQRRRIQIEVFTGRLRITNKAQVGDMRIDGRIFPVSATPKAAKDSFDLKFQSLSEPWANTTTHAGKMIMTVFAGVALLVYLAICQPASPQVSTSGGSGH